MQLFVLETKTTEIINYECHAALIAQGLAKYSIEY
ncbi:MAG: hypothetical protein ACJAZF_004987 [Granulosicoccus sp.]|jgi:hypothetical protein